MTLPATAHAMVGVALGLLLVFRTNASYARYWEGRILLGRMVNNCRDLARQSATYLAEADQGTRDELRDLIVAMAATITAVLHGDDPGQAARDLVGEERAKELSAASAAPLLVSAWLSQSLVRQASAGRLSEMRLRTLDTGISDLIDCWGGCERILKTPVPFAYAHHIKSFLTIFCFTAPLTMLTAMGWIAPVAGAIVTFGLFGIEEIGVEIEDPFGRDPNDLPMDAILETIRRNVWESMPS